MDLKFPEKEIEQREICSVMVGTRSLCTGSRPDCLSFIAEIGIQATATIESEQFVIGAMWISSVPHQDYLLEEYRVYGHGHQYEDGNGRYRIEARRLTYQSRVVVTLSEEKALIEFHDAEVNEEPQAIEIGTYYESSDLDVEISSGLHSIGFRPVV